MVIYTFSSTFRRESPFEMKYTFPNTLSLVVSEYMWLWGSISKTLGVVAIIFLYLQWHLQEGGALFGK